jgi:hypothetical protein
MRTISVRVVIVPPRFEGLPTASSQTVPMDGCFVPILSLLMIDQRFGPTRRMSNTVDRRSWTNPEEVHSSSTAFADERRLQ